jgi:hypothetical protein
MPFKDTNTVFRLPPNDQFQVGKSDIPPNSLFEQDITIPWASDLSASWVYYDCNIGTVLDSGIVVHNRLPQINGLPDTLARSSIDDPSLDTTVTGDGFGVGIKCKDQYKDIVQRMGHARYWFRLWGQAMRVGYQIPIPGLKTVGDVPAIPYDKNPQWAYNGIVPGGNYSGVILWYAEWSLWYTTAVPPRSNSIPASNPAAHISGATPLPTGMQAPFSQPDDNAVNTTLPTLVER